MAPTRQPRVCPSCSDVPVCISCGGSYSPRFNKAPCQNRLGVLLQMESLKPPMRISYLCVTMKAYRRFLVFVAYMHHNILPSGSSDAS